MLGNKSRGYFWRVDNFKQATLCTDFQVLWPASAKMVALIALISADQKPQPDILDSQQYAEVLRSSI